MNEVTSRFGPNLRPLQDNKVQIVIVYVRNKKNMIFFFHMESHEELNQYVCCKAYYIQWSCIIFFFCKRVLKNNGSGHTQMGGMGVTSPWSPLGNFLEGQAHPNVFAFLQFSSNRCLIFCVEVSFSCVFCLCFPVVHIHIYIFFIYTELFGVYISVSSLFDSPGL